MNSESDQYIERDWPKAAIAESGHKESLTSALKASANEIVEKRQLFARIEQLESEIHQLKAEVAALRSAFAIQMTIASLSPGEYALRKNIPVVVQGNGDDFIATFVDANVNASGCNETDAVDNLKSMMLDRLVYLASLAAGKLGPALAKQLTVLQEFIQRKA